MVKRKKVYPGRCTRHRQTVGHLRGKGTRVQGCHIFMGWVISKANEGEDYSNYFEEGEGIASNLAFYGQP